MLRTVHLHGALKRRFKHSSIKLDADSVAEAMRGLAVQLPGFTEYVRDRKYLVTVANDQDELAIEPEALQLGLGNRRHIHLIPAAQAAGLETVLIVGLVLVAVVSVGAMFLMRPKVPDANAREKKDQSFIFGSAINSTVQGSSVPLLYGTRIRTGSVVVSAGITTTDVSASAIAIGAEPGGGGGGEGTYVGSTPGVLGSGGGNTWAADRIIIHASKGGKSGASGYAAEESPNTLRSQATVKIVDLVGEGEIGGLVDGLKSVYLDGTPVQNPDGSFNFSGYSLEERVGLPDQTPMPGFTQQESAVEVGVDVTHVTPVVRTVSDPVVDVVRVTLSVQSLFQQDTTNGDLNPSSVQIAIDHQANGGGFTEVVNDVIAGKTNSPYQRSYDVRLDGEGPHDIRVRRITPDSDVTTLQNATHWDSMFEIVEAKLTYPDSALYGVTVDAKQFGSNIPVRTYEVKGLVIDVPSNYDPVTRTYTGIWDGTFKRAVSDNPAWVLYDIIKHDRYGLGSRIPVSSIDKYGFYAVAQYSDGLVPDGKGGQQPRYTINAVINSPESAYNVLASIASAFRGFVYWGSGSVFVTQDRPEDPSILVTPANVVDGRLSYQTVIEKQQLRSVAIVYWNDPENNYELTPEIVEDDELVRRMGWQPGDSVVRFGCTNRAEAHFAARWILDDQKYANKALKYDAADDHNFVTPGTIASVGDPKYTNGRRGGRVRPGSTTTTVQLDAPVTLTAGQVYCLRVVLPDGTVGTETVSSGAGQHASLALGAALVLAPAAGAVWALESDVVANRQFRIRSATADEPPYSVYAVLHDPESYDRVELDLDLQPVNFIELPGGPLTVPDDLAATEFLLNDGTAATPAVMFTWNSSPDPRILFFQARFKRPNGEWEVLPDGSGLNRVIRNSEPGDWGFMVRAVDGLGRKTPWAMGTVTLDGQVDGLADPTGVTVVRNDAALTSVLRWTYNDYRPVDFEVRWNSINNYASSTLVALTKAHEFVISRVGYYFVTARFLGVDSNHVVKNVATGDLPVGASAFSGYLTNSQHNVPTDSAGNVTSYTGAGGQFVVMYGTTDVTSACTFSIVDNPQGLSIPAGPFATGAYSITGGFDASEPLATVTMRATHPTYGHIDLVFSLGKSPAGANGAPAQLIDVSTSHYTFRYDTNNSPLAQTTTIKAARQNTTGTTEWSLFASNGTQLTAWQSAALTVAAGGASSAPDNDTLVIDQARFNAILVANNTNAVTFAARLSSAHAIEDLISIAKVQDGVNAKHLYLDPTGEVFRYDASGTIYTSQVVKITIRAQNLNTTTCVVRAYRLNADGTETQIDAGNLVTTSFNSFTDNVPDANSFTQALDFVLVAGTYFQTQLSGGQGLIVEIVADGITTRQLLKKVQDGATGSPGSPGAPGSPGSDALGIVASPPAVVIQCNSGYVPVTGQLPVPFQFKASVGATDVTGTATWGTPVTTNCAVTNLGGGAYRLDSLAANSGGFSVPVSYAGRSAAPSVTYTKSPAGAAAQRGQVNLSNPSLSYAMDAQTISLNVGPGQTITMSTQANYSMVGAGSGREQAKLMYRDLSAGPGPWTQVGAEIIGGTAYNTGGTEPDVHNDSIGGTATVTPPVSLRAYEFGVQRVRTGNTTESLAILQVEIT